MRFNNSLIIFIFICLYSNTVSTNDKEFQDEENSHQIWVQEDIQLSDMKLKMQYSQSSNELRFKVKQTQNLKYLKVNIEIIQEGESSPQLSLSLLNSKELILDSDEEGFIMKKQYYEVAGQLQIGEELWVRVFLDDDNQKREIQYFITFSSSDSQTCNKECNTNGTCINEVCQCDYPFIGHSCSIQTKNISEGSTLEIQIGPISNIFVSYYNDMNSKQISYVEFMVSSITPIIDFEGEFYLSTGSQFPNSQSSFLITQKNIPFNQEIKIRVDYDLLFDSLQQPEPINIRINSFSKQKFTLLLSMESFKLSIFDKINHFCQNNIIYIGLGITFAMVLCFYALKKCMKPKAKLLDDNINQEGKSLVNSRKLPTNEHFESKKELLKKMNIKRAMIASPKIKMRLEQVKTLNNQIINKVMPAQQYIFTLNTRKDIESKKCDESTAAKSDNGSIDPEVPSNFLFDPASVEECLICKSKFKLYDNVRRTICDHLYHDECIVFWLNKNEQCPSCNQSLSKIILYQHFHKQNP